MKSGLKDGKYRYGFGGMSCSPNWYYDWIFHFTSSNSKSESTSSMFYSVSLPYNKSLLFTVAGKIAAIYEVNYVD